MLYVHYTSIKKFLQNEKKIKMKIILSFDIFFPKGDRSVQISSIKNKTKTPIGCYVSI